MEGFAKDITDHIKEVRRRSVAFDRCATRCSYAIAAHTHDLAKKTRFEGQQAQLDNTRSLADIRREQYDQSSAIYYGMRSGQEQILFAQQWMRQEIGNEMQQQVQGLGKKLEVMLGNTWKAFLASNDKVDPRSCTREFGPASSGLIKDMLAPADNISPIRGCAFAEKSIRSRRVEK